MCMSVCPVCMLCTYVCIIFMVDMYLWYVHMCACISYIYVYCYMHVYMSYICALYLCIYMIYLHVMYISCVYIMCVCVCVSWVCMCYVYVCVMCLWGLVGGWMQGHDFRAAYDLISFHLINLWKEVHHIIFHSIKGLLWWWWWRCRENNYEGKDFFHSKNITRYGSSSHFWRPPHHTLARQDGLWQSPFFSGFQRWYAENHTSLEILLLLNINLFCVVLITSKCNVTSSIAASWFRTVKKNSFQMKSFQ